MIETVFRKLRYFFSFSWLLLPFWLGLLFSRIQRERFDDESSYQDACKNYIINATTLNEAKPEMKILHPLPRNQEIDPEVDNDQDRAAYFRQAENGKYVRMALLATIL